MKTKKFNRKLDLNKRTIANLDNRQMNAIAGGTIPTYWTICGQTCETPGCETLQTLCDCGGGPPETEACEEHRD